MVNDEPLVCPKQLVRDHERTNGVVGCAAPRVAYDMSIAFRESCIFGGIETGIHAGENREAPCRRQREVAFFVKAAGVSCVRCNDLLKNSASISHRVYPSIARPGAGWDQRADDRSRKWIFVIFNRADVLG